MIQHVGGALERQINEIRARQAANPRPVAVQPQALANQTGCPEIDAARVLSLATAAEERRQTRQRQLDRQCQGSGIPARHRGCSFDNYHAASDEQHHALKVCRNYSARFAHVRETGANLLLLGSHGTGKTHLATAIALEVMASGATAVFTTEAGLLATLRATYQPGADSREEEVLAAFLAPDLLAIDEGGVGIGNPETRRAMLYSILNGRYEALKPSLICSNLTASDLARYLGVRAWDRLTDEASCLVRFDWPSWRQRARA